MRSVPSDLDLQVDAGMSVRIGPSCGHEEWQDASKTLASPPNMDPPKATAAPRTPQSTAQPGQSASVEVAGLSSTRPPQVFGVDGVHLSL